MPRCCMPGCKSVNTSAHYFPKDLKRCSEWVRFVRTHKPTFVLTPWAMICGEHFEIDCYTHNFVLEEKLGCQRMRRNLTEDAVPTLAKSVTEESKEVKESSKVVTDILQQLKHSSTTATTRHNTTKPVDSKDVAKSLEALKKLEKGKNTTSMVRKIAPKNGTSRKAPVENMLLKGKVLVPLSQSQAQLLLVPTGAPLANIASTSTTSLKNTASSSHNSSSKASVPQFRLPFTIGVDGKLPQKLVIKPLPERSRKKELHSIPKEIIVKKKVVPKHDIIPMPAEETELFKVKSRYTLQELKKMHPHELVWSFSSRVKISDSNNYALRCRMGSNCPFVISCPSENDCRSVMRLHLKKHIDWWTVGTAGNPFISSQLTFESSSSAEVPSMEAKSDVATAKDVTQKEVPCISETSETAIKRTEGVQAAFQKLYKTIAAEVNQFQEEKHSIKVLMGNGETSAKQQQEKRKRQLDTCQSPRRYLIPGKKLKLNKEKTGRDRDVNIVLRPLERFTNLPHILACNKKSATVNDPGMPVITAVRGSVKKPELDNDSFHEKETSSIQKVPTHPNPGALGIANEMIANAKATFDTNPSYRSEAVKGLSSLAGKNASSSLNQLNQPRDLNKLISLSPPSLSELARRALLQGCDELVMTEPHDVDEELLPMKRTDAINYEECTSENTLPPWNEADIFVTDLDDERLQEERQSDFEIVNVFSCTQEKQSFLKSLGLIKVSGGKDMRNEVEQSMKPLFKTRLQKKAAVLEKFFKKKHASMTPKRVEIKLTAVKTEPPDEIPGNVFEHQFYKPVADDSNGNLQLEPPTFLSSRDNPVPRHLLSKLKERVKSNHDNCHDPKTYQLKRAELLKKRARDQAVFSIKKEYVQEPVGYDQDPHVHDEVDNYSDEDRGSRLVLAASRVMRMPRERMSEVLKEDQRLICEMEEEEADRKMEMQIHLLRKKREKLEKERIRKEEEEKRKEELHRSALPVTELLPPGMMVLRRRPIALPDRSLKKSFAGPKKISSRQIVVDGRTITIQQEIASVSDASDVESFDEGGYSSDDEPVPKRTRLSEPLGNNEPEISNPLRGNYDEFDSTDTDGSEDAEENDNNSDLGLELFTNDANVSFKEEKIYPGSSRQPEKMAVSGEVGGVSSFEQQREDTQREYHKALSKSSKLESSEFSGREADYADPSGLSEAELKVRERALEYLKKLKLLEKERNRMFEAGELVPEQDTNLLSCKICDRIFTGLGSLYYHYRSHAGVKPFKCDICNKSFTRLPSLNYHIMVHANKTRFQCQHCGKGFRHPSHYKEHLNKHTGEEPFRCQECSRRFKTSNSLRRHLLNSHGLKMTIRIGDHMPTISELEKSRPTSVRTKPPSPLMRSVSPPLPDSPPRFKSRRPLPKQPVKPLRLTLFPKNGLSRVCFADDGGIAK